MIQCDYSAAPQYMRCLWKSISQPGSLRPPPPPSKELPPSRRRFIIAQAVQLRLQPERSFWMVVWYKTFFFLHLQHQPRVSHREQPTFTFHISQPVWLGHLAHSVVVLCDCRLSHTAHSVVQEPWRGRTKTLQLNSTLFIQARKSADAGSETFCSHTIIFILRNRICWAISMVVCMVIRHTGC